MELFASCQKGLEPLLVTELEELGFQQIKESFCGVWFSCENFNGVYLANYAARLPARILLPFIHFPCKDRRELYGAVRNLSWGRYFEHGETLAVAVSGRHPAFSNTLFAAQVVKDAICDQLVASKGTRPSVSVKNPDVGLSLFLNDNQASLYFDTSGQPLYKRGYRNQTGDAPLQETLAAALLRLADYHPDDVLIDPCCGSGTLLIEAALIAAKIPPGFFREHFGFMHHPDYDQKAWMCVKNNQDSQRRPLAPQKFYGLEIDKHVASIARHTIKAAGLSEAIIIDATNFTKAESPHPLPTLAITNPPHGNRLGDSAHLVGLYRDLGDFFKHRLAKPARAFVFTTDAMLSRQVGLRPSRRHVLTSSGQDARLVSFHLY